MSTANHSVTLTVGSTAGTAIRGYAGGFAADMLMPVTAATVYRTHPILVAASEGAAVSGSVASHDAALLLIERDGAGATARQTSHAVNVPLLERSATAVTSRLGTHDLNALLIERSASGVSQRRASHAVTLDAGSTVATAFTAGIGHAVTLPAITLAATAVTSRIASRDVTLPLIEHDASAMAQRLAGHAVTLPLIEVEATATAHRVGAATITLPMPATDGAAVRGSTAGLSITLPLLSREASLSMSRSASHLITLPAILVTGTATNNESPDAGEAALEGHAYAMHTQTKALVQDTNNRFNSYAVRGTAILAANEDGLFLLGANTDAGELIDTHLTLPLSDMDDAQLKRVGQMTVGYQASGTMRLSVLTDDGNEYGYLLRSVPGEQCQPNRVKIGKGMRSRYWSVKVENTGGCDHAIDKLDIDWEILSRRVP